MNRWLRRLFYLLIVFVWLIVMSFPVFAFILSTRGELQMGDAGKRLRFFLILEQEAQGIGMEWTRPLRQQPTCARTTVNYMLWEGEGKNVAFCQCFDPLTGSTSAPAGQTSCNSP